MYLDGEFSEEKYIALLCAVRDGEVEAKYELGRFWVVLGSDRNDPERISKGFEFLFEAADEGSAAAACYLGRIYHEGEYGVARDMEKAVAYYKQGAEGGDPLAMSNYGIALQNGDGGVPHDHAQAFYWLKKAADADESLGVAQYNVALACHAGLGTEMNRVVAKEYFQRAAKAGIGMAELFLHSQDYNKS